MKILRNGFVKVLALSLALFFCSSTALAENSNPATYTITADLAHIFQLPSEVVGIKLTKKEMTILMEASIQRERQREYERNRPHNLFKWIASQI